MRRRGTRATLHPSEPCCRARPRAGSDRERVTGTAFPDPDDRAPTRCRPPTPTGDGRARSRSTSTTDSVVLQHPVEDTGTPNRAHIHDRDRGQQRWASWWRSSSSSACRPTRNETLEDDGSAGCVTADPVLLPRIAANPSASTSTSTTPASRAAPVRATASTTRLGAAAAARQAEGPGHGRLESRRLSSGERRAAARACPARTGTPRMTEHVLGGGDELAAGLHRGAHPSRGVGMPGASPASSAARTTSGKAAAMPETVPIAPPPDRPRSAARCRSGPAARARGTAPPARRATR